MRVRVTESFADPSGGFVAGRILDLPDPMPPKFVQWMERGLLEPVRTVELERAVVEPARDRAVRVHRRQKKTGRRGAGRSRVAE